MEVGKVRGDYKSREHLHNGLQLRIGHQRQIDQALDRAPIEGLPSRLVFGLDLIPGRVCGQVNAEQAKTRERAVDGLRGFALHNMQIDLQAGGVRELHGRSSALEQLHNQLVGFFEITAQDLALRAFEPQAECQLMVAAPVPFVQQCHAGRKIHARRRIRRGRLGLAPGTQVDRRYLGFLVEINQQRGAPIELVGNIEHMFGETGRRHARKQQPANPKVCPRALAIGDQRVGRLLNTVMEEGIRILQAEDQPSADGVQQRSVDLLFSLSEHHAQCRDLDHVPETSKLLESGLRRAGQSPQLPHHEIHHVVGVTLGANPIQVPDPGRRIPIEPEQAFLNQGGEKLDREERITAGLLVDQQR
jgi:hypothetical protein